MSQPLSLPLPRKALMIATATLALTGALLATVPLDAQTARRATRPAPAPVYTGMVRLGDNGSHIIGNPAARVQLTEYVSYTCIHCANFTDEAAQPLRTAYVARGTLSIEVRHIVRDPVDMTMALATNCGAASRFFSRHDAMMGQHAAIMARVRALPEATLQQWGALPMAQRFRRVADDAGVTAWMQARGFTAAQINSCLADTAKAERLVEQSNQASALGVRGTPSFAINGTLLDAIYAWSTLRPAIDAALAR